MVLQGQCKEGVSSQGSQSPGNPENENNRKRVSLATGNCGSPISNAEVGSSQLYRQEMVNQAARKLGQKDLIRPKSEKDSLSRGKLDDAVSPEMENMKFSIYPYVQKIFQSMQKKLGRSSFHATFTVDSYKNNMLAWRMFMTSSMKAAIHLGSDFLGNSEIYKHTKFENIDNVFIIIQKLVKDTVQRQRDDVGQGQSLSTQIHCLCGQNRKGTRSRRCKMGRTT